MTVSPETETQAGLTPQLPQSSVRSPLVENPRLCGSLSYPSLPGNLDITSGLAELHKHLSDPVLPVIWTPSLRVFAATTELKSCYSLLPLEGTEQQDYSQPVGISTVTFWIKTGRLCVINKAQEFSVHRSCFVFARPVLSRACELLFPLLTSSELLPRDQSRVDTESSLNFSQCLTESNLSWLIINLYWTLINESHHCEIIWTAVVKYKTVLHCEQCHNE